MPTLKLHLDDEEFAPVHRLAESLHVRDEDVAYAALNRMMLKQESPDVRADVVYTREWRKTNLPKWGDAARGVHIYESKEDEASELR
ncbi:MAG: hypothetical protein SFV32_01840 [Opitutaceae bacterium]|nr:hypothetical protein [Opitutaceae bacterium]